MQPTHATLCRYNYDALDRLINQHQPNAPTHQRFYCKSRLATEIHGTLGHSIIQHDDLLLAEQKRDGNSTDTLLLATDLQRSVLNTMKQGVAPQPIAYSPYGHRPTLGGLLSLLGFNGERPDPLTGHYLLGYGYRAFNPVLMRFNSPDSWSPFGKGGINSYIYCLGDPINSSDQSGRAPISIIRPIAKLKILGRRVVKNTTRKTGLAYGLGQHPFEDTREAYKIKPGVTINEAYAAIDKLQSLTKRAEVNIVNKLYNSHHKNRDFKFITDG